MAMKKDGQLAMDFAKKPGRVAYHIPCHLRDQNIGFKSKELMECAGAQVEVTKNVRGTTEHGRLKRSFSHCPCKLRTRLCVRLSKQPADLMASDCPLAGLHSNKPARRRMREEMTSSIRFRSSVTRTDCPAK